MRTFGKIAGTIGLAFTAAVCLSSVAEAAPPQPAICPVLAGQPVPGWVPPQAVAAIASVCSANQNWD
ncbi:hypothetical protein [Streptacidiphilus rugosus]|uniref:hypothetical protein n=1 Tax=Streptacidiphilus rugosus TaxID=405783 RepID=UPI00056C32DA|nr:hypothetical protein [Streptacidiphilus rugosus]